MNNYLYILVFVFILIFFLKSNIIGQNLEVLSEPDFIRKLHKKAVPQVGGIILFLAIISLAIIDLDSIFLTLEGLVPNIHLNKLLFFVSFILLFLIGFIDDRRSLDPKTKLVLLTFVAYILLNSMSLSNQIYIRLSFYKNIDLFGRNLLDKNQ